MVWKRRHGHRLWLAIERLDLPTMFRLRLVIPISVFALTAMVAILPSIASADGPAAVKVDVPQPIAIDPTALQLVDDIVPPTDPASGN